MSLIIEILHFILVPHIASFGAIRVHHSLLGEQLSLDGVC